LRGFSRRRHYPAHPPSPGHFHQQLLAQSARLPASTAIRSSSPASCLTAIQISFPCYDFESLARKPFILLEKNPTKTQSPYFVSLISFLVTLWGAGSGNDSPSGLVFLIKRKEGKNIVTDFSQSLGNESVHSPRLIYVALHTSPSLHSLSSLPPSSYSFPSPISSRAVPNTLPKRQTMCVHISPASM
jgi:hypothetical protein